MSDIYRLVTKSGVQLLYELEDGGGTAVEDLLATGTGEYDVYRAKDLGSFETWEILA